MEVKQELREEINFILAVKSSQRCGTERCSQYDSCDLCLTDQILAKAEPLIPKAIGAEMLARPELREKIDEIFDTYDSNSPISRGRVIGEILALIPDEEIIRKDEREGIKLGLLGELTKLSEFLHKSELPDEWLMLLQIFVEALRQALKGEK